MWILIWHLQVGLGIISMKSWIAGAHVDGVDLDSPVFWLRMGQFLNGQSILIYTGTGRLYSEQIGRRCCATEGIFISLTQVMLHLPSSPIWLLRFAPVKSLVKIQAAWCNSRLVMGELVSGLSHQSLPHWLSVLVQPSLAQITPWSVLLPPSPPPPPATCQPLLVGTNIPS